MVRRRHKVRKNNQKASSFNITEEHFNQAQVKQILSDGIFDSQCSKKFESHCLESR